MAKTKKAAINPVVELVVPTDAIVIDSMDAAVAALEQMEEISEAINVAMQRTVELKKEVTEWAIDKKVSVIQLDGRYYRQIVRHNSGYDVERLKKTVKDLKDKKGKPLWNFITRRVPDPEKIDRAVKLGLISQKKVDKCFTHTPQKPFLQKFQGEGIDG